MADDLGGCQSAPGRTDPARSGDRYGSESARRATVAASFVAEVVFGLADRAARPCHRARTARSPRPVGLETGTLGVRQRNRLRRGSSLVAETSITTRHYIPEALRDRVGHQNECMFLRRTSSKVFDFNSVIAAANH